MHYIKDKLKKRIDLYFEEMPSDEVRDFLKNEGWHWNKIKHCWYSFLSEDNINSAEALGAVHFDPTRNNSPTAKSNEVNSWVKNVPGISQDALDANDDNTLYIHKGRIVCQTRQHNVIQVTAVLSNAMRLDIELNVSYCTQCKKFFMSHSTYQHYRNQYGIILGDLKMLKREDFTDCEDFLAEESPLHLCGYNVSEKTGLSAKERQNIIDFVISYGVMEKAQVISHLGWLIEANKAKAYMGTAVSKWDADLSYVLRYDMDKQKRVIISGLKKYRPNQFKV